MRDPVSWLITRRQHWFFYLAVIMVTIVFVGLGAIVYQFAMMAYYSERF